MTSTVTFRLQGLHLLEDERVAVVGSSPSLGCWAPNPACCLDSTGDSHQLRLTVEHSTIEYKYVILQGSNIRWEGGVNRVAHIAGDVECMDTWVSEGASGFMTRTEQVDEDRRDIVADIGENAPLGDVETMEAVDENAPHIENVPPEPGAKGANKCETDSRKPEAFTTPFVQRSPFLLIDGIFRMCGGGTPTN